MLNLLSSFLNPRNWLYAAILGFVAFIGVTIHHKGVLSGKATQSADDIKSINLINEKNTELQKQIENARQIYNQSLLDASKQSLDWSTKVLNAESKANEAQAQINIITANNHVLSDKLRDTTAEANRRASLPSTSADSSSDYIKIANSILNDCTAKYLDMAKTVDEQQIDEQKLIDSYPQN
jgi:ribonuclease HII